MNADDIILLKKIYQEVVDGYSPVEIDDRTIYIKHFKLSDFLVLDDLYKKFIDEAKLEGVPSQQDKLKYLKENGLWSDKDDQEINELQSFIQSLEKNKGVQILPSIVEQFNKDIRLNTIKLNRKKSKLNELCGLTADTYANHKITEYHILYTFFKDRELTTPLLSNKEFINLVDEEVDIYLQQYFNYIHILNEENIKKLAASIFFQNLFVICENDPLAFYGKPVIQLTTFQQDLFLYAKIFRNIIINNPKIPESIRNDPNALLDYHHSSNNAQKIINREERDNVATSLIGATKEDIQKLNIESDKTVDIFAELRKKGGELRGEDIMKLRGMK